MFFLGTHADRQSGTAAIAVIKKTMKNIKNYYTLCCLRSVGVQQVPAVLNDLYHDPLYRVRKRVFSQDRRPKKDVNAHPKVVIASDGTRPPDLLLQLRKGNIPADGLLLGEPEKALPSHPVPTGIGRDFFVFEKNLVATLPLLLAQGRLIWDTDNWAESVAQVENAPDPAALLSGIEAMPPEAGRDSAPSVFTENRSLILAVAAPLWFRENIRYRQTYQSSARSVRRFT